MDFLASKRRRGSRPRPRAQVRSEQVTKCYRARPGQNGAGVRPTWVLIIFYAQQGNLRLQALHQARVHVAGLEPGRKGPCRFQAGFADTMPPTSP
ncbi:hypothetical protein PoB_003516000 [Plakobranchus ocellatus]|uniref:Uncharacterized protein n=1 Tax=Plakobranchus ocellatus TaxID=259542 RepID=A0AAV4AP50_9GAST|nr:hypothetical protein PoB_003516000 [Plakobranchus ocellatus]